jgi:hypothetical protein
MQAKAFPATFFCELRCKLGTIRPTLKSHTTRCSGNANGNVYDGRSDNALSDVLSISLAFSVPLCLCVSVSLWFIPVYSPGIHQYK